MALIYATIILILLIVIIILFFKSLSKIIHIIIISLVVFFLLLGCVGYFTYKDVRNIMDNVDSPYLVTLSDKDIALTAVSLSSKEMEILNQDGIDQLNKRNYKPFLEDHFKIIFIDVKVLDQILPEKLEYEGHNISKQTFLEILRSEEPLKHEMFRDYNLEDVDQKDMERTYGADIGGGDISEPSHQRLFIVLTAMSNIEESDLEPVMLFDQYKKGNIRVYKETIAFKLVKLIPNSVVEEAIKEL